MKGKLQASEIKQSLSIQLAYNEREPNMTDSRSWNTESLEKALLLLTRRDTEREVVHETPYKT